MEEKKKDSGFVVKDKRLFGESAEDQPRQEPQSAAAEEKKQKQETQQQPDQEKDYPAVNFTNFILSLSTSALFHFGDIPDSEDGSASQKNLPAAKQIIDILDMLNEKTKGNLDDNEKNLIQGVLYELKMRYVKEKV
jgi:hypothetical protein